MLLTVNYTLGTTFFVMTVKMIELGKQDAWLIPLWSAGVSMGVALPLILLHRYYPGKSIAEIPLEVMGRRGGMVISLLFLVHFCLLAGWVLRNLSDFLKGTFMPETPISVFHIMFLIIAAYAVGQGLETVARMTQFITPFLFFPFWASIMIGIGHWEWGRFQPMLQKDLWEMFLQSHQFFAFPFMDWLVLMMIYPFVKEKAGRTLVMGLGLAGLTLSMVVAFVIGLLGVARAQKLRFPIYTFVQEISIGEVIVNIHSIVTIVLLILIYIKAMVLVFGIHLLLKQLFQFQSRWPILIIIVVLLAGIAASIYQNSIQNDNWVVKYYFVYCVVFTIGFPFLLLIIIWFKKGFYRWRGSG